MTKISRIPLAEHERENLKEAFWQVLVRLRKTRDIETLLINLLTSTEVEMFSKRLRIVKLLLHGSTYAEIRRELKVTDYPITRLSNTLHADRRFGAILKNFLREIS
ncbi:MAG: Trp family transcriptional regulator [bacterium]|nr:Trp family transcriptional regulator [bacterium]